MAGVKQVNYSAEQVAVLVDGVKEKRSVKELADLVGKTERSVVAKLAQLGLYEAKAREAQAKVRVTKAQLVAQLEARAEMPAGTLESLEKADKAALEALVSAFA